MRLSVVVPAFNVQDHIGDTLRSLSRQGPPLFEVIVVNDGSTDHTLAVIEQTVALHPLPRFQLLNQPNAGVSVARNNGLSRATGDYVLFLDGDDTVSHRLTLTLVEDSEGWLEWPDVACWRYLSKGSETGGWAVRGWEVGVPGWSTGADALRRFLVTHQQELWIGATAFNRKFLQESQLAFSPGLHSAQDREFLWRALGRAGQLRSLDSPLSTYVWRPDSITNSPSLKHFDGFLAYDRAAKALDMVLGEEYRDVVEAVSRKSAERFVGHFVIHSRTHPGGSGQLLHDLEERQPGIIDTARERIRTQEKMEEVDPKWRLFRMSPSLAGRYFESVWSQDRRGLAAFPLKTMRHIRRRTIVKAARARTKAWQGDVSLWRAAARVRREGPSDGPLSALASAWGNPAYSADLQYLSEVTRRGMRANAVLECGSGLTTVALGALGRDVWTLEHDPTWFKRLVRVLKLTGGRRIRAQYAPLRSYGDVDWYTIPPDLPDSFDLVICDGPPGRTRGGRAGLFRVLATRLQGATVLLDDVHRPAEQALLQGLEEQGWSYMIDGTKAKKYAVLVHRSPAT